MLILESLALPVSAFTLVALLLGAFAAQQAAAGLAINTHLTSADQQHLQRVFTEGLATECLQSVYYSAVNLKATPTEPQRQAACQLAQRLHSTTPDAKLNAAEKHFYLFGIYKKLQCASPIPEATQNAVVQKTEFASAAELFYTVRALGALSVKLSDQQRSTWAKSLATIVRKDDSIASLGYAFNVAAELGAPAAAVADWLEAAVAQADEIDGKQLQFEGGLSVTALVLNGIFK